jgi:hypothetical protein
VMVLVRGYIPVKEGLRPAGIIHFFADIQH